MIEQLCTTKSATFYAGRRGLSNDAVDKLFRSIRARYTAPSQNLFLHRRQPYESGAVWPALSFFYERPPSFLTEEANVRERVCGFVLLIEYRDHVAVFRSGLEIPSGFKTRYLGRVDASRVDAAIAHRDAIFERIRLRGMSVSKQTMRSKTLEAADLANVVGPLGASRYAPQGYLVNTPDGHYSATPSTGRITHRSDRIGHEELIDYACEIIDLLRADAQVPSEFIRSFARVVDFATAIGSGEHPSHLSIDVAQLTDEIFADDPKIRLVRQDGGNYVELSAQEIQAVLQELDAVLGFEGTGRVVDLVRLPGNEKVGTAAINKGRIALRSLDLPATATIEVEHTSNQIGTDPERVSLRRYIDQNDAFIVLFDNLSLAYITGTLFKDDAFVTGGGNFLRYLQVNALLENVTSEKGAFVAQQVAFDALSTFGVIVANAAADDNVLVCDDLDDEWADFIGLNTTSVPLRITFYHAKHGALSLGAGPFHIAVSQAIKNLGRLALSQDRLPGKIQRWLTTYNNDGVETAISRLSRGTPAELAADFEGARTSPDAIRRVCIVTSSLSKTAVQQAFASIANGQRPSPYFVQLYWLLLSFFSACQEAGASGHIICRP